MQEKAEVKQINELLVDAAASHNLEEIKRLISEGANVNHIRYTNSNCWYSGDTYTPLYSAVHTKFKENETNYIDVIELLLKNGANPNFKVTRGNWNHCTDYPLFSGVAQLLSKFQSEDNKIRFLELFVKNGININQSENHSRSKNWRGYSTHSCFIFQIMDALGIPTKIYDLKKSYKTINFEALEFQENEKLKQQFNKEFPHLKFEKRQPSQHSENILETKKKVIPEIKLVEALIKLGADPNSSKSQNFWENYNEDRYDQEDYAEIVKFDQKISQTYQTVLHRAVMNDLPILVQLLLSKGANPNAKCKITVDIPVHPHQWPEKLKQKKIQRNISQIKQNEESKAQYQKELESAATEDERNRIRDNIRYVEFQLFKCKRYSIENQHPIPVQEVKELSCLEIAEMLDISQETKSLLTKALNK